MSWGPWIEHDGKGCPVAGHVIVAVEFRKPPRSPDACFANPAGDRASKWVWIHDGAMDDIVRFRIRKPRGMEVLESILAQPERELEAAQ